MVPEQGPTTSQACCHAPPYAVENGSNPTWLQSLSRVGIAAVDLHLKICEIPDASFIDTKLPAMYVAPATHLLGHPGVLPTEAGDAVVSGVRLMLAIVASDSWPLVRRKPEAEAKTEAFIDATARTKKVMVSFMMMMVMMMMMMMTI